jgi:uncharacterized repeat protein (TIGR03943 family)
VTRQQQSIMLIVVGAVTAKVTLSGGYLNYIKAWQYPYLLAAGGILLAIGVIGFVRDGWRGGQSPDDDEHDHGHRVGAGWLLCLPMFIVFLVLPPSLGSYAANRYDATVPRPAEGTRFAALPAGDPVRMKVNDYAVRAVWNHGRTLRGRTVTLTGFVTPRRGGGWYLTRMKVTCCAADARAYRIAVLGTREEFPADSWIEVTGTWTPSTEADPFRAIPRINATAVHQISRPAEPYE